MSFSKQSPEKIVDINLPKELTIMLKKMVNEEIPDLRDYVGIMWVNKGEQGFSPADIVNITEFAMCQYQSESVNGLKFLETAKTQLRESKEKINIDMLIRLKEPKKLGWTDQIKQLILQHISLAP